MFKKILIPLDGSKLAECALHYAEELAKGCNTEEMVLVSVTERTTGYRPIENHDQPLGQKLVPVGVGKKEKQAQKYLDKIAKPFISKGISVRTEVLIGNPAEEITIFTKYNDIDMIVMSSHGRSGPSRWTYGSVADKVFRASHIPVLMVRAPGCQPGV